MTRRTAAAAGAGVLSAAAWAAPALAPVSPPVAFALRLPRRTSHGVALTFDDGPHPEGTPAVLDALGDTRATFFMVGERVLAAPDVAREVVARGHGVGVHGHRHRNLLRLSPAAIARDLDEAQEAIATHTGVAPVIPRPGRSCSRG